ncbi:hypothetical protein GE061_019842 [Apolygus lucorum]|uniref:Protein arginine methyltransferase NDUFAF7 n=1 Tax=Apolygus lucorum TaxID=248454 RepID=A0A6A4JYL8_APOLU|nr:hypothetical protein GE061_019842 [Apolygus lucorum]
MIAVWLLNEWQKIGSPKPFQLVELGPGRGTMMKDILRVLNKLKIDTVEVHLVEVSKELSKIQASNLCVDHLQSSQSSGDGFYQRGLSSDGVPIFWHQSCTLIPKEFSVVVAHEFFDALPIHKFQKTENGWREVLVDVDPKNSGRLRFVLADKPTPASVLLVKKNEKKDQVEISPLSGVIMGQIAEHLEAYGGFALVADYGHFGEKGDTFRAFRKHQLHDPLVEPGSADLTADVDFSFLKESSKGTLVSFGPVTQHNFLKALHIDIRLKKLLASAPKNESEDLLSGYKMIMDENGMGNAFKFMSFFPAVLGRLLEVHPPTGFQLE